MAIPGSNQVKIYDFATKSVTIIPKAELAPGMVEAFLAEFGEKLWIDPNQIQQAPHRHPAFDEKRRRRLRKLVAVLGDVFPKSVEEWEDGFRRDTNPDLEIGEWLRLAEIFQNICEATRLKLSQKIELFKILVQCSVSSYESIRAVIAPESLPEATVTRAIEAYYGEPALKKIAGKKPAVEYPDPLGNTPLPVEQLRTPEGRERLKNADIVFGVDSFTGQSEIFFGREYLEKIVNSGVGDMANHASFLYDSRTDQLELLVAAIQAAKGYCCYKGNQ